MRNSRGDRLQIQLPEYQFILERIIRILSLHEDSISFERLTRAVAQTMPPEYELSMRSLRRQMRSVLFDLKMSRAICCRGDSYGLWSDYTYTIRDMAGLGNTQALEEMLTGDVNQSEKDEALISAVINNQFEAARMLINAGADVNAKDNLFSKTVSMYVSKRTKKEMVQLLREAGALDLPAESDETIAKQ